MLRQVMVLQGWLERERENEVGEGRLVTESGCPNVLIPNTSDDVLWVTILLTSRLKSRNLTRYGRYDVLNAECGVPSRLITRNDAVLYQWLFLFNIPY